MISTGRKDAPKKSMKTLAREIREQAREYPADVRDEVLDEFVAIAIRDRELSAREIGELYVELGS